MTGTKRVSSIRLSLWGEAGISLAGDAAMFLAGPLAKAAGTARAARNVRLVAAGIQGGIGTIRSVQAGNAIGEGKYLQAAGNIGEAALRFLGMSKDAIQAVRAGGSTLRKGVSAPKPRLSDGSKERSLEELFGNYKLKTRLSLRDVSRANRKILNDIRSSGRKIILDRGTFRIDAEGRPVYGSYNPVTNTIRLYNGADLSTLSHELIHFKQLVKRGYLGRRAPDRLKPRLEGEVDTVLRLWGYVPR